MNKKTFTLSKKIDLTTLFRVMFLTFIFSAGMTQAQSVTCNSLVNISLDENCQATVGADQILEGTHSNYNIFTVTFTNSGLPAILNANHIGQTLSVTVTSPTNSCSGLILVEDKFFINLLILVKFTSITDCTGKRWQPDSCAARLPKYESSNTSVSLGFKFILIKVN